MFYFFPFFRNNSISIIYFKSNNKILKLFFAIFLCIFYFLYMFFFK